VIRTGKSELVAIVPPELIEPTVGDAEESRLYIELGVHSSLTVPLTAEGETLGALAVLYGSSLRQFAPDDIPLFEELGRRAGLAIHKARLFEREHRAAESFQEASLPATLPDAPGLVLDAFYAPGRAEAQVGGDWYDALRLVDGRVVVSIGDVAGSGLQAAVTMGNMRQIIRGIAQVHADPALMLDAADRALRLEHPDKFVTAFVGVFDPIDSTLKYASAGHPPPLIWRPGGGIERLAETGLPLGLRSNAENTVSTTRQLAPGSYLLLYTDGLTEFHRTPVFGERRLAELLNLVAEGACAQPAKRIVERMMNGGGARDDVAVLVLNIQPPFGRDGRGRSLLQRWSLHTGDAQSVVAARRAFVAAFSEHSAAPEDVAMAEIVFGELVSNTVRYAPGPVEIIVDWSGPDPVLNVLDHGPGFRHLSIMPPDLMSESGRGLFIVSALTHDFRISKSPNGGSHARAALRMQSRLLVNINTNAMRNAPLYALGDRVGITAD
jgi:anti-sigma regulatory factor (Ser/Thr protein kinase)